MDLKIVKQFLLLLPFLWFTTEVSVNSNHHWDFVFRSFFLLSQYPKITSSFFFLFSTNVRVFVRLY